MFKMWELIMCLYLLLGAVGDLRKREISVAYLIIGTILAALRCLFHYKEMCYISVGGAIIGGAFLLLSKYTNEQIGYGDSWMILILGIYLGIWELTFLLGIVFGCCFLFSFVGLLCRKLTRHTRIPFFPFLMIGYIGVMIC